MGSLGESICAKFNTAAAGGYPNLWIKTTETEPTAYTAIASTGGQTKTLKEVVPTYSSTNTSTILDLNSAVNRADPIEMFMRGQSVASTGGAALTLASGLLKSGSTTKYISEYLYGTDTLPDPVANATNVASSTLSTSGKTISIIFNELIRDSLILKSDEIYNTPDSTGKASRTSLIRLYQAGITLTTAEQGLKTTLEQRNLKFFSAFLMEYCFYRTRYFYMLQKYFTTFQDENPGTKYDTVVNSLPGPTLTTTGVTNQQLYMNRLAFHMARCNMVMADMRKLLAQIRSYYDTIFQNVQTNIQGDKTITGSDSSVRSAVNSLQDSAEKLKTYIHETEFRKAAMEYNQEKNRYGSMLLAFYAVLNLSALAMIYKLR